MAASINKIVKVPLRERQPDIHYTQDQAWQLQPGLATRDCGFQWRRYNDIAVVEGSDCQGDGPDTFNVSWATAMALTSRNK